MRDAGTALRKGYSDALNGFITVDGNNFPLYYGKIPSNISTDFFGIIQEISVRPRKIMHTFIADAKVYIDIIKRVSTDVSMEDVEAASDQILQIVKPTAQTTGISIAAPFKLINVSVDNNDDNKPVAVDSAKFVVSKSLVFNNIVQN